MVNIGEKLGRLARISKDLQRVTGHDYNWLLLVWLEKHNELLKYRTPWDVLGDDDWQEKFEAVLKRSE